MAELNDPNSNDTGYGTTEPFSDDHVQGDQSPVAVYSTPSSKATPGPTVSHSGMRDVHMRKSTSNPDYLAGKIVSYTDHNHQYKNSNRRKSLSISRGRLSSYPLSDDNSKGKALDSERTRPYTTDMVLSHNADSDKRQISNVENVWDTLRTTHKSPDYGMRLEDFIKQAEENGQWSKEDGFTTSDDSIIMHFYKLANLHIRSGGTCSLDNKDLCLLCCRSTVRDKVVGSHIFSNCLLKSYSKIHGDSSSEYIFDPSPSHIGMYSSNKFTLPLFCSTCDNSSCNEERLLRNLYLCLMDPDLADKTIEVSSPAWLWYVLAAIMFRGMLLLNYFELIRNDVFTSFQKAFLEIRHYLLDLVTETGEDRKVKMRSIPSCLMNNFGLYLLPIGSFQNSVPNITTLFDFTVRNPQHTDLVQDSNGPFLCTNFDCFYLILRLNNCDISLKDSCLGDIKKPYIHLPSSSRRRDVFPNYLLQFKFRQTQFVQTIGLKHNKSMSIHTKAITERLPRRHSPNIFANTRQSEPEAEGVEFFAIRIDEEEMCQRARQKSPIAGSELVKELVKEKKALEEKKKQELKESSDIYSLTKQIKGLECQLKQQLNTSERKEKEANKKIKQLEQKVTELEKELLTAQRTILMQDSDHDRGASFSAAAEIESDLSSISLYQPSTQD